MGEGRSRDNLNYGGRGNFRARGQEPLAEEDMGTSIKRDNNLNPRGGNSFGCGKGRSYYNQERTYYSCFHRKKFEHKATDWRYKHHVHIAENSYQNNSSESYENPHALNLASSTLL